MRGSIVSSRLRYAASGKSITFGVVRRSTATPGKSVSIRSAGKTIETF
jgi:hypothetical protein